MTKAGYGGRHDNRGDDIMGPTARQWIYAVIAITGVAVTWYFNLQFIAEHGGLPIDRFIADVYVNAAASSIGNDLLVVVAAFLVWSFAEARRLGMRHWWVYPILTFGIAIAFAMPFFLWMRERRMAALAATA
ncbi:DUF2834 domain-containing protein [Algiphilus sp.]|uniref:DUF2834 domain-containing protein n=2 Tax=Algiphilus sp. TaxID=1872431 RepID=UPI003C576954